MTGRMRVTHFIEKKRRGEKIAMLTAYDYTFAKLMDRAGIDAILVGDSLGNVVLGYETTLPVTMQEMLHHTRAVRRGVQRALLIADMPFLTFQVTPEAALLHAGQLMQEGGADAVKVEGGEAIAETVHRITSAGIPVMGHLGMTPQSVHQLGGFRTQGTDEAAAERIVADARALEQAGAFSIVLEMVPPEVARRVGQAVSIPTIGIGASAECDGQVLVSYDMLGMFDDYKPRFVKAYASLAQEIERAVRSYINEVREGAFPAAEHHVGGAPAAVRPEGGSVEVADGAEGVGQAESIEEGEAH